MTFTYTGHRSQRPFIAVNKALEDIRYLETLHHSISKSSIVWRSLPTNCSRERQVRKPEGRNLGEEETWVKLVRAPHSGSGSFKILCWKGPLHHEEDTGSREQSLNGFSFQRFGPFILTEQQHIEIASMWALTKGTTRNGADLRSAAEFLPRQVE